MAAEDSVSVTNPYLWNPDTDFEDVDEISKETAIKQGKQLVEAINEHDRRYYTENNPIIPDRTYDELFARLNELEDNFELNITNSPTDRVGGEPIDEFTTVEHSTELLSIQQSGEETDLRSFDSQVRKEIGEEGYSYFCEPKFDGISLALYYENGELKQAVTRGNGSEGEDVTRNVKTVREVPLTLRSDPPDRIVIRGELFMEKDSFQDHNAQRVANGNEPFANPRNATAGTIRQQDPEVVSERPLTFSAFSVLEATDTFTSRKETNEALEEYGLPVFDDVAHVQSITECIEYRNRILSERDDMITPVDGVVIKVNEREYQEKLGFTSSHPRWAFAYKFPSRTEETILRNVTLQVGRTGRVTPVAMLDPVDVDGVTIARASLHNPEQIEELSVGCGDKVRVERAGDVIPQVSEVVESNTEGTYTFPKSCPVCGNELANDDGPVVKCTGGLACDSQRRRSIEYYCSRDGLDVEGLGEETISTFIDSGLIETLPDIYTLDVSEIASLEGFGETSAKNITESIAASTEPELTDFLTALGIEEVGRTVAKSIAYEFGDFDSIRTASKEELLQIDDIGAVTAERVREFFENKENKQVIRELLTHVSPQRINIDTGDAFEDKTIVFTGSLPSYSRTEASDIVEREGGNVTSSVSSVTDILVIGENPGKSKVNSANEYGTSTVSGKEFERRLDDV